MRAEVMPNPASALIATKSRPACPAAGYRPAWVTNFVFR